MPQKMQLNVLPSDAEKVVTISDGGLFLDVSSIQMFDANGAAVTDAGVVVTVGISADGLSYQSKVASSNASLGGFEFNHIKVSVSGRTTASTVVVGVKVCSISEAMTSESYKSRLAGLFTATPYTTDTLPDPATLGAGTTVVVDGRAFTATGDGYSSDYYAGSGIPFVMPSSGNVTSTSGAVSVTTAFHSILGPSFTWYQQGALFALSPAGWYFTVWTSTTVGKVYANTYLSGEPSVPASPTPLTTVIGSYTQVINQYINGPAFAVPGSVMGKNGVLEWHRHVSGFSSATQKTTAAFFGLEVAHSGQFTTNSYVALAGSLVNRGTPHRQVCANSAYGDSGLAGSLSKLVTDTLDIQFSITAVKLAAATDYVIIEAATTFAKRGV